MYLNQIKEFWRLQPHFFHATTHYNPGYRHILPKGQLVCSENEAHGLAGSRNNEIFKKQQLKAFTCIF